MGTKFKGTEQQERALNAYIKLQRAAETILTVTTDHLSDYGLTTTQFSVLEALYHLGMLSQGDLASKLLKTTGNMTSVLKTMEKRGWITRDRDPNDNRYRQICITTDGKQLLESLLDKHIAGIENTMSVLTPQEQGELSRLCKKLGLSAHS